MKRIEVPRLTAALLVALAVLPTASAVAQSALPNQNQLLLDLESIYTKQELEDGVYVGSEFCLACHPAKATWRDTKHAVALRRPLTSKSLVNRQGVVADYDKNGVDDFRQGLDFNRISSAFNRYKPNAPKLSIQGEDYFITIGQLKMRVVATQGGTGEWRQLYLVEVPVSSGGRGGFSADNYLSPVQYNEATREYVAYQPQNWYTGDQPKFNANITAAGLAARTGASFSKECIGCHATGVRNLEQAATGEWAFTGYVGVLFREDDPAYFDYNRDGMTDLVNIGCEACHGPGSVHIFHNGDPDFIINPDDLSSDRANEICGQCHLRVRSVPEGTHGWPYNDRDRESWRPGDTARLAGFFRDAAVRWPDGVNSKLNYQQYFDFLASGKPSFPFHPVRCSECHDPHGDTTNRHLVRDVVVEGGITIPTQIDNDSLCLSCHAGFGPFADLSKSMIASFEANREAIGRVVSVHTHHPFAPERSMGLSRCVLCHMPKIATSAVPYDINSHSFEAIPPEKNLAFQNRGGMPDSCSVSCHGERANLFDLGIDDNPTVWTQAFDRQTARHLEKYFGPGGIWWDTSDMQSLTFKVLESSGMPETDGDDVDE